MLFSTPSGDHLGPAPAESFARAFGLGAVPLGQHGARFPRGRERSYAGSGSSSGSPARSLLGEQVASRVEVGVATAQAVPPTSEAVGLSARPSQAIEYDQEQDEDQDETLDQAKWNLINPQTMTYFIAGGLAGAASRTVVSPLERLKIILQVQPRAVPGGSQQYTGVWSSLVRMYKEEGLRGYMKGNGVNCARIIPYSAVQFASYETLKSSMKRWSGQDELGTTLRLTAGALAGICSVVSTYPLDLVRSRLSIATASMSAGRPGAKGQMIGDVVGKELGIWGMTKKVYATEGGIRGLYRGIVATAAGVAPYVSLNFFIYESLKTRFIPEDADHHSDVGIRTLLCGATAGTLSQTVTYPFDVLRRKMQVAGISGLSPKYNGAVEATIYIIRTEGWWGGMYKGLWPNLLKVAPSIATSFFVYETVKEYIQQHHKADTA